MEFLRLGSLLVITCLSVLGQQRPRLPPYIPQPGPFDQPYNPDRPVPENFEHLVPVAFDEAEDQKSDEYPLAVEPFEVKNLAAALDEPGKVICSSREDIKKKMREFYFKSNWARTNHNALIRLVDNANPDNMVADEHNPDYAAFMRAVQIGKAQGWLHNPREVEINVLFSFKSFVVEAYAAYKTAAYKSLGDYEARRVEYVQMIANSIPDVIKNRHMDSHCREFLRKLEEGIVMMQENLKTNTKTILRDWITVYYTLMPKFVEETFKNLILRMPRSEYELLKQTFEYTRAAYSAQPLPEHVIRHYVGLPLE